MDLSDIMGPGGHTKRPDHADFWRLSEIIMQLKARMAEHEGDLVEQERVWRESITAIGDFDSISYHAIQCAVQIHGIQTAMDWQVMLANPQRHHAYVATVQAYYDGFTMGAEFQKRGGHREGRIDGRGEVPRSGNGVPSPPEEES